MGDLEKCRICEFEVWKSEEKLFKDFSKQKQQKSKNKKMSDSESDYDHSDSSSSSSSSSSDSDSSIDELCVCCERVRPDPSLQLEDGYYCADCYESQKQWD